MNEKKIVTEDVMINNGLILVMDIMIVIDLGKVWCSFNKFVGKYYRKYFF